MVVIVIILNVYDSGRHRHCNRDPGGKDRREGEVVCVYSLFCFCNFFCSAVTQGQ